jgi:hypothetical protein
VLLAVELLDPIALSIVSRGVTVEAVGLKHGPIGNRSGRFVWLEENGKWPEAIKVAPQSAPFWPHELRPVPRPGTKPEDRLVRITLRPTPAYPLEAGVTAIRGHLCESDADGSPGVKGARVQLAWHDENSGDWLPPPPQYDGNGSAASPPEAETNGNGDFAVFLRLNPPKTAQPELDPKTRMLAVRLQFTRPSIRRSRATPTDFAFLPILPKGRVPEGQLLQTDPRLGWAELDPI